jgi:hypothetical protein
MAKAMKKQSELLLTILEIVKENPISGAMFKIDHEIENTKAGRAGIAGGIYLNYEREFGISAKIDLQFEVDLTNHKEITGRYVVCVGWGSTTRSIVETQAALILYRQVADLATLLQCRSDAFGLVLGDLRG